MSSLKNIVAAHATLSETDVWSIAGQQLDKSGEAKERWDRTLEYFKKVGFESIEDYQVSGPYNYSDGVLAFLKQVFPEFHLSLAGYTDENSNFTSFNILVVGVSEKCPAGGTTDCGFIM